MIRVILLIHLQKFGKIDYQLKERVILETAGKRIDIDKQGNVKVSKRSGTDDNYISLEGLSFYIE